MTVPKPSAEQYLAARARQGMKFGLETMRALMEALVHPERTAPALLVAGTNGKGSVVAYVDAVLRAGGLVVGRYISPHLLRVHERIAVGGREIGEIEFEEAVARVRRAAEALVARGRLDHHPTYFETLTAAAFEHFRISGVQVAVIEVGLGGRLDATNVCDPVASAIVTVDLDHQEYLGETLAAIATEKAGVMRQGRVTVVGPMATEARQAIGRAAEASAACVVDAAEGVRVERGPGGLEVRTPVRVYRALRPLPGAHQRDNLVVALRLLEAASAHGVPFDPSVVPSAIAATRWPGRLQHVAGDPPVLLDGAHNAAGARALADELAGREPFVLLFAAMADKDVAGMAAALFGRARHIVLTRVDDERAADPGEIARKAGEAARRAILERDPRRALARARELARPDGTVVIAGSLYLVGAVLQQLRAEGLDIG